LALFASLSGDVDKLGLLRCEAGPRLPSPSFNPWYVLSLDFGYILFGGPANPPAKIIIDEG
jgi:hypothetical protein